MFALPRIASSGIWSGSLTYIPSFRRKPRSHFRDLLAIHRKFKQPHTFGYRAGTDQERHLFRFCGSWYLAFLVCLRFQEETRMTGRKAFRALVLGLSSLFCLTGCPWSKSPNVFDGAEGISMPRLNGPPPQTEPPLADESTSLETGRPEADFE
jgi:hypothetical protein